MIIKTKNEDFDISEGILGQVFEITIEGDTVTFTEGCDGYYEAEMTSTEAIKMLEYFIQFIKSKI